MKKLMHKDMIPKPETLQKNDPTVQQDFAKTMAQLATPGDELDAIMGEKPQLPETIEPVSEKTTQPALKTGSTSPDSDVQELQKKITRLKLIQDFTRHFSSTLNVDELMKKVFNRVLEAVDAEAGSLWLSDAKTLENICEQAQGPTRDQILNVRLEAGKGVVGWCIENKKTSVVLNTAKDKRFSAEADKKTGFSTKSMICVPLIVDESAIGAIQIINKKTQNARFTDEDVEVAEALAANAAIAIKNAKLFESENKIKDLTAILQLSKKITSTLDIDGVLLSVVNLTSQVIAYTRGIIALINDDRIVLGAISGQDVIEHHSTDNETLRQFLATRIKEPDTEQYIEIAKLADDQKSPELLAYAATRPDIQAIWLSVLKDEEGVIGVMVFESTDPAFIQERHHDTLGILANQTTVALRNSLLYTRTPMLRLFNQLEGSKQNIFWFLLFGSKRRALISLAVLTLIAIIGLLPIPLTVSGDCAIVAEINMPVYAGTSGVIVEVAPELVPGARITQGQVLAALDTRDAEMAISKLDQQLADNLAEKRNAQAQADVAAIYAAENARIQLLIQLSQAQSELAKLTITAPVDGLVLTPDLTDWVGKSISTTDEFLRIARNDRRALEITVPQTDIAGVRPDQPVIFTLASYPDRLFRGSVERISPESDKDPKMPSFKIRAALKPTDQSDNLLVGMTGRSVIQLGREPMIYRLAKQALFKAEKWVFF